MGRLKMLLSGRPGKLARGWSLPIVISLIVILIANQTLFASTNPTTDELTAYLQTNALAVGSETVSGRQQIYYIYNGDKIFVTTSGNNHTDPHASGQYITWVETIDGEGQIFLYDVLAQTTVRISNYSTNLSPRGDGIKVVWEKWLYEQWQVFYYDGLNLVQISDNSGPAIRPHVKGDQIIYTQESGGTWDVLLYTISTGQTEVFNSGDETASWPHFAADGSIQTNLTSDQ